MDSTLDLFDPLHNGTDTSIEAAKSIVQFLTRDRSRVYECVIEHGGATCDEVEAGLQMRHQTASARLHDLHSRASLLVDSGQRRKTRSGRGATVWVAA